MAGKWIQKAAIKMEAKWDCWRIRQGDLVEDCSWPKKSLLRVAVEKEANLCPE